MIEIFKKIPPALQKQIIMRAGACIVSLLLTIVVLVLYRDLYLSLAFVLFFLFFGIGGAALFLRSAAGKYIAIGGRCTEVERTAVRKRPKAIFFTAEPHTVRLQVKQRLRNVSVGDEVIVYASENTPVYQNEGCQILSGYLAIEIKRGGE